MTCSSPLYRAFTAENHARDFVAGRFRIGRLDMYRDIEDAARSDATEGYGYYVDGSGVSEYFELGNPVYILCCSGGDIDLSFLKSKMGPFVIKIANPAQLATDIADCLNTDQIKIFGDVKCRAVEYTKGSEINVHLDEIGRAELSVTQKHPLFSPEKEHRFFIVVNTNGPTQNMPTYIDINLKRILDYVELLRF